MSFLFRLESDFVAYETQVLTQDSVEVSELLCSEHSQLDYNQDKVENAENGLTDVVRVCSRRIVEVLFELLNEETVACDCFFTRQHDVC